MGLGEPEPAHWPADIVGVVYNVLQMSTLANAGSPEDADATRSRTQTPQGCIYCYIPYMPRVCAMMCVGCCLLQYVPGHLHPMLGGEG